MWGLLPPTVGSFFYEDYSICHSLLPVYYFLSIPILCLREEWSARGTIGKEPTTRVLGRAATLLDPNWWMHGSRTRRLSPTSMRRLPEGKPGRLVPRFGSSVFDTNLVLYK